MLTSEGSEGMLIEETVKSYLDSRIDCPVWLEMPKNPPDKFILVERTGRERINMIDHTTLVVQSYGNSLYEATIQNEVVQSIMDNLVELSEISQVTLKSSYNFTDVSNHRYRYQAVYHLVHY